MFRAKGGGTGSFDPMGQAGNAERNMGQLVDRKSVV